MLSTKEPGFIKDIDITDISDVVSCFKDFIIIKDRFYNYSYIMFSVKFSKNPQFFEKLIDKLNHYDLNFSVDYKNDSEGKIYHYENETNKYGISRWQHEGNDNVKVIIEINMQLFNFMYNHCDEDEYLIQVAMYKFLSKYDLDYMIQMSREREFDGYMERNTCEASKRVAEVAKYMYDDPFNGGIYALLSYLNTLNPNKYGYDKYFTIVENVITMFESIVNDINKRVEADPNIITMDMKLSFILDNLSEITRFILKNDVVFRLAESKRPSDVSFIDKFIKSFTLCLEIINNIKVDEYDEGSYFNATLFTFIERLINVSNKHFITNISYSNLYENEELLIKTLFKMRIPNNCDFLAEIISEKYKVIFYNMYTRSTLSGFNELLDYMDNYDFGDAYQNFINKRELKINKKLWNIENN